MIMMMSLKIVRTGGEGESMWEKMIIHTPCGSFLIEVISFSVSCADSSECHNIIKKVCLFPDVLSHSFSKCLLMICCESGYPLGESDE